MYIIKRYRIDQFKYKASEHSFYKSVRAEFLRLDAFPGVYHMRGMQYQIVINITLSPELNFFFFVSSN